MRNGASARGTDLDADADANTDVDAMQVDSDAAHSASDSPDTSSGTHGERPSAGWTIRGIVKKKIVFSKRPMPVMAKKLQASS